MLAEQIKALLIRIPGQEMLVSELANLYQRQHGVAIDPSKYEARNLTCLMAELASYLLVSTSPNGVLIKHVKHIELSAIRVLALLMDEFEVCA